MAIDFHDDKNRNTYADRDADESWLQLLAGKLDLAGVKAADVGCGGGIYTKALAGMGAAEVIGIDFSQAMLEGAAAHCDGFANIRFQLGHALQTGLPDCTLDVVLERALIHHLSGQELADCFREANRLLGQGGTLVVQDRTPDDCLLEGGREHLRGYFFEKYPRLIGKETRRRHTAESVHTALTGAGFSQTEQLLLWETRKQYAAFSAFRDDMMERRGRSLLHELNTSELAELVDFIQRRTGYSDDEPVEEKDRWTVWIARKH